MKFNNFYIRAAYVLKAYFYLPITFTKRVVFGRDSYWKQFFWSRWGFPPKELLKKSKEKKTIWINAQAGGEVTQIFTFCKLLRQQFVDYCLIASVNEYRPLLAARRIKELDFVFDQPWDLDSVTRRTLKKIKPIALIFVEHAPYPKLLKNATRLGIPTILVSGFMSKNWPKHQSQIRPIALKFYRYLQYIGVKEEIDAQGYLNLGAPPERIKVTGNMKFDLDYLTLSEEEKDNLYQQLRLKKEDLIFLAASLLGDEGRIVIEAYNELKKYYPHLKLIFVPRYNNIIPEAEEFLTRLNFKWVRRTQINKIKEDNFDVIIVDTFGELNRLYALASVIFLGGSIVKSSNLAYGKNIIEPLIQKKPIFFGPHMRHWVEIIWQLKNIYPYLEVHDSKELTQAVINLLKNPLIIDRLKTKAQEIIDLNQDAVRNNVEFVTEVIRRVNKTIKEGVENEKRQYLCRAS
jgi:3-deoxy-D-manno-octulosonic-acid transferase